MTVKTTKTATKTSSKSIKVSNDKKDTKIVSKKTDGNSSTKKKVVVRRRKTDLIPTRASAVAIVAQSNRTKKEALIKKLAKSDAGIVKEKSVSHDTKIPIRVRIFFGCSLFLFCISFYKAIIFPQLDDKSVDEAGNVERINSDTHQDDLYQEIDNNQDGEQIVQNEPEEQSVTIPETAEEVIQYYFNYLSNRQFDDASNLMMSALRNSSEIRDHFTSFRMNPFLDGIQGGRLTPTNFEYVNSPSYGKDAYKFDLSYVMISDNSKYDETWEFTVNTQGNEPKISSIRCVTSRCSYHPIFWPENFGLMR